MVEIKPEEVAKRIKEKKGKKKGKKGRRRKKKEKKKKGRQYRYGREEVPLTPKLRQTIRNSVRFRRTRKALYRLAEQVRED